MVLPLHHSIVDFDFWTRWSSSIGDASTFPYSIFSTLHMSGHRIHCIREGSFLPKAPKSHQLMHQFVRSYLNCARAIAFENIVWSRNLRGWRMLFGNILSCALVIVSCKQNQWKHEWGQSAGAQNSNNYEQSFEMHARREWHHVSYNITLRIEASIVFRLKNMRFTIVTWGYDNMWGSDNI